MADSWLEAVEIARKEGKEQVYHDFDKKTYGICMKNERPGHFSSGCYIEHLCICMSASLSPEELEQIHGLRHERRKLDDFGQVSLRLDCGEEHGDALFLLRGQVWQ